MKCQSYTQIQKLFFFFANQTYGRDKQ